MSDFANVFESSSMGYIYHKIVLDKYGVPCDYTLLSVNSTAAEILGADKNRICNKTLLELMPDYKDDPFNWVEFYGKIALEMGEAEFEQYSVPLKKWFRIQAFSTEKYYFHTIFTDITPMIEEKLDLQKVVNASARFLAMNGDNIDYQFIVDTLAELTGAKYAVFHTYNEDRSTFRARAIYGVSEKVKQALKILGYDLMTKNWDFDQRRNDMIKDNLITDFADLMELSEGVIPKLVIEGIQKVIHTKGCSVVQLVRAGEMVGDFVLLFEPGKKLKNRDIVELFVRHLGLLISRIEAEEQVKKSEELYRLMAENSSDVIWVLNLNTMKFLYNSPSVYELRGFTPAEADAQKIEDNLTPESLVIAQKMLSEEVPLFIQNPDFSRVWLLELEQYHIEGHTLWTELAIKPRFNKKGELELVGVTRSIEKRKILEMQLHKQTEDQQILLENIPTQIWYLTDPSTCGAVNKAYADFNGLRKEDMEHRSLYEVYPQEDADRFIVSNKEVFESGEIRKIEQWVTDRDGEIRLLILTYTPKKGADGKIEYVVCSAEDITDFRQAQQDLILAKEKAEESDKLKTAFLASMNHELRTPLNHIMGFSQLITTTEDISEIKDCANHIYHSGEALLKMIQDIFDLALAEQSIMRPRPQSVKCFDHFFDNKANLEDIFESSGKQGKVELIFSPDLAALRKTVFIDVGKVNQVLNNLFRSAVKFTHSGKIEFGFELLPEDSIRYFVNDTGIGIPPEKQEIIFDFFRQADDSNARIYGGVGIGLAISKKVTEVMKGKLMLKSEEGIGSRFCLEVPCSKPDQIDADASKTKSKYPDYSACTILLVEDDLTSMAVTRNIIEMTGARILEATNGRTAIDLVEENPGISAILMDLMMPDLDGYQTTQMIKNKYPEIPILALSAHLKVGEDDRQRYNKFDALITKPINKEILFLELSQQMHK